MKIIQIIQKPQLRGAEIFACQLADELQKRGHEVIVISLFRGDSTLPFRGRFIQLNLSPTKRFIDWTGWKLLSHIIKEEQPDIVQANAGDTLKYAVLSKLLFRWNGVLIFRNASTVSLYIGNNLIRWWISKLYARVDHIISVSDYTKNDIISLFPFVKTKTSVVPIGIVPHEFDSQDPNHDQIILLHIGGFTFEKNHIGLVRIFESFRKIYSNSLLWLVGDGPLRKSVEEYVVSKQLRDCVQFWGYQADPLQFLKSCDAFLLPSIIEGLPGVILEAFYCRAPVVAYHVGGIPELVKTNETGWLIEKGNEQEFCKAITEVMGQPQKAKIMTENAHKLVIKDYSIDQVTEQFLSVYHRLIASKNQNE